MYSKELLERVREIVESGYYQRLAPAGREKKSLCERIEAMSAEGEIPLICEVSTAIPGRGLVLPSRGYASSLIDGLSKKGLCALDLWVEPREHAGDLRWLSKKMDLPVIHNDWIVDERQIVGGDAVVLDLSLLDFAQADFHSLVEAAHLRGLEAVVQIRNDKEMEEAKRSEADCIMINNLGSNGGGADISLTINALRKNGTGRPVISSQGIMGPKDVRSLVVAGVSAIEFGAAQSSNGGLEGLLSMARGALKGKSAEA